MVYYVMYSDNKFVFYLLIVNFSTIYWIIPMHYTLYTAVCLRKFTPTYQTGVVDSIYVCLNLHLHKRRTNSIFDLGKRDFHRKVCVHIDAVSYVLYLPVLKLAMGMDGIVHLNARHGDIL